MGDITGSIKCRLPNICDRQALGVCEKKCENFIGVGIEECFDKLQIIDDFTPVE